MQACLMTVSLRRRSWLIIECLDAVHCELEDRCEQGVCAAGGLSTTCFTTGSKAAIKV